MSLLRVSRRAGCVVLAVALLCGPALGQDDELRVFGKSARELAEELASGDRDRVSLAARQLRASRKRSIPILRTLMADERALVLFNAIDSFYTLVDPEMEPILVRALADEDEFIREWAYRGLICQGPQVLRILKKYMDAQPPLAGSVARFGPAWPGGRFNFCITAFDWSPDGSMLAVGDGTGRITVWDWREDADLLYLRSRSAVEDPLDWSPDGGFMYGPIYDALATRTKAGAGIPVPEIIYRGGTVCAWSPDSKRLACGGPLFGGSGGWLTIIGVDGKTERSFKFAKKYAGVSSIEFFRDGKLLVLATYEERVAIVKESGEVRWLPEKVVGQYASWSSDGRRLALSGWDRISVVTVNDGETVWSVDIHSRKEGGSLDRCEWSPDGNRIMFSPRPRIEIRHAGSGVLLRSFDCRPYYCSGAIWSPEGRRIALHDTMANVWILDTLPPANREGTDEGAWDPGTSLDALWDRLGDTDSPEAMLVEDDLARGGSASLAFLVGRLSPVEAATGGEIRRLIEAVVVGEEGEAETARTRLAALGPATAELIGQKAIRQGGVRTAELLAWASAQGPDVRTIRALSVLVRQGTLTSRAALERIAGGQAGAPITEAARGFLKAWR